MNKYIAQALAKLRNLVSSRQADAEFEHEIHIHLEFLEDASEVLRSRDMSKKRGILYMNMGRQRKGLIRCA